MNDSNSKIYNRQPDETDRQWLGFCCYRDLGLQRTVSRAYRQYLAVTGKGSRRTLNQAKKSGVNQYFINWKRQFKWDDRVRVWDAEGEARMRQLIINAEAQKYTDCIQGYQKLVETVGSAGLQLAANGMAIAITKLQPITEKLMAEKELTKEEEAVWRKLGKPRDLLAIAQIGSDLLAKSYNIAELLKTIEMASDGSE